MITDLFKHNLCFGSFIPPKHIRNLRELLSYRFKLVNMSSSEKQRIQNSLTISNISLDFVLSDLFGKSAKSKSDDIITSIQGFSMPDSTISKLKASSTHLNSINDTINSIEDASNYIINNNELRPYVNLAMTVPGISETSAMIIVSEIGTDMSLFSTTKKLCNWAGLTPQNNESAGKKKSTRVSLLVFILNQLLFNVLMLPLSLIRNLISKTNILKSRKDVVVRKLLLLLLV